MYQKWLKWDRFVNSCLNETFTNTISTDVLGCATSAEVWSYLSKKIQNTFSARKSLLRNSLFNIKRGSKTISDFLQEIKYITDSLAAINEPVSSSDMNMHILNGLGSVYNDFVVAVQTRDTELSFADLKSRLINHEQWLQNQQSETKALSDHSNPSIHFTKRNKPPYRSPFRDKQQHKFVDYPRMDCQIRRQMGHSATTCRFCYAPSRYGQTSLKESAQKPPHENNCVQVPAASFTELSCFQLRLSGSLTRVLHITLLMIYHPYKHIKVYWSFTNYGW
ncbi:hypothetical protein MKX01_033831 [Papaver californicum]|nr:hypothetical protein MKX01_033831 [Papaver californicum]